MKLTLASNGEQIEKFDTMVHSELHCRCPIYSSAQKSLLLKLDSLYNKGLRIAIRDKAFICGGMFLPNTEEIILFNIFQTWPLLTYAIIILFKRTDIKLQLEHFSSEQMKYQGNMN